MQRQINNPVILDKTPKGYKCTPGIWRETNKNTNKNKAITKSQAREKTKRLINALTKKMIQNIDNTLNSGAIDMESYKNNYELPEIITYALLENAQNDIYKESAKFKSEMQNIYASTPWN